MIFKSIDHFSSVSADKWNEVSNRLVDPGPQWAVNPKDLLGCNKKSNSILTI